MAAITTIFFDLGGVCLSNSWDREQRQALARQFGFDVARILGMHPIQFVDAAQLAADLRVAGIAF